MPLRLREEPGAVVFDVKVTPRAAKERVGPVHGDRLKLAVTAPPVEGAANAAVCALLARALGVAKGQVEIVRGETGGQKSVRVRGVAAAAVRALAGE